MSGVTRVCLHEAESPLISFFVPCLNEEPNVCGTLDNLRAVAAELSLDYEVLVVDDCSTDATVAVTQEYMHKHADAPLVLLINSEHQGLGRNFAHSARVAKGRYYMIVNGDNVERREVLLDLLSRLGQADIVMPYFGKLDGRPLRRRIVSRTFTFIVNAISGNHLQYYNGAVLHRRENVVAHHPATRGFGHQAELLTALLARGASYIEIEVPMEERQHGHSSAFKWQNFLSVGGSLWRIARNRLRGPAPKA